MTAPIVYINTRFPIPDLSIYEKSFSADYIVNKLPAGVCRPAGELWERASENG